MNAVAECRFHRGPLKKPVLCFTQFYEHSHTQSCRAASKDGIIPLTPIFLSFSNSPLHPTTTTTFQATFPFFLIPFLLPHIRTHPLLHPQHSPPRGAIVTQWEGSVTPVLLPSATTPPVLFLLPLQSRPARPTHPMPTSCTPASCRALSANGNRRFINRSGGCKAARQQ